MMRPVPWLLVMALACSACGSDDDSPTGFRGTLTDHPDTLTTNPGDNVARLEVMDIDEPTALNRLLALFEDPSGTNTVYEIELETDANDDGLVGSGDVLLIVEPPADVINDSAVGGPEYDFSLARELGENRIFTLFSDFYAPN